MTRREPGGNPSAVFRDRGKSEALQAVARRPELAKVGLGFLALSVVLWVPLPVVPFLPLSGAHQAALAGALVVSAEVAFWVGAVLAGPEAARRVRSGLRRALGRSRAADDPPA